MKQSLHLVSLLLTTTLICGANLRYYPANRHGHHSRIPQEQVQHIRRAQELNELVSIIYNNDDELSAATQSATHIFQHDADKSRIIAQLTSTELTNLQASHESLTIQTESLWMDQGSRDDYTLLQHADNRDLVEVTPYGISMIQADTLSVGPHPVQVCIVDSGLDVSHIDIDDSSVSGTDRRSYVDSSQLYWNVDNRQHGTHVAGIISATVGDDQGVRGVGNFNLHITRGLNDKGLAFQSDILEAVEHCEKSGAKIITLSLGGQDMNREMDKLFDRLYDSGIMVFSATGNYQSSSNFYPAAHPGVIAVTAIDANYTLWSQSNYGPYVELAAPGVNIISTAPNNKYASFSGTSMAAPHAAASAALLWSHFPECSSNQIRYALAYTAKDLGTSGCDDKFGYGLVQVGDAFTFLANYPCEDATWGQEPTSTGYCSTIDQLPVISETRFTPLYQTDIASVVYSTTFNQQTLDSTYYGN